MQQQHRSRNSVSLRHMLFRNDDTECWYLIRIRGTASPAPHKQQGCNFPVTRFIPKTMHSPRPSPDFRLGQSHGSNPRCSSSYRACREYHIVFEASSIDNRHDQNFP